MDRWGRQVELLLGNEGSLGRRYRGLRVSFSVKMTSSSEPNSAVIRAYGVGKEAIAAMQEPGAVVRLNAGYDAPRLIFQGSPTDGGVTYERLGAESLLTIEAEDGGREFRLADVNFSFATDTTAGQVIAETAEQLGIPVGYIEISSDAIYPYGYTAVGKARTVLDNLAVAEGSVWYIRDGALYWHPKAGSTGESAIVLSSGQGNLIGTPILRDGNVEVRALLDPSIRPGRPFIVIAEEMNGLFTARDVTFVGDSGWTNDYYVNVVGEPA